MNTYADQAGPLWAVTSYFNPVGYRRRRENYRVFREQLKLPLVAIELSFNGHFELQQADAEILIQIHGRDVMWQKERLLNVAVQSLPPQCTQVAILDCDVVFMRSDWTEAVSRLLEEVPFGQPFSTVHYTPPDLPLDSPEALTGHFTRPGVGHLFGQGVSLVQILEGVGQRRPGTPSPGHALIARRELLQTIGLYDAAIIGGGDLLLMAAISGAYELATAHHVMNDAQAGIYRAWANRWNRAVSGQLGCVSGDLVHLWHGEMTDRRTLQRYQYLAESDFHPALDIAVDSTGCWRWNSDKPALHARLREYFAGRKEDGPQSAGLHAVAKVEQAAA